LPGLVMPNITYCSGNFSHQSSLWIIFDLDFLFYFWVCIYFYVFWLFLVTFVFSRVCVWCSLVSCIIFLLFQFLMSIDSTPPKLPSYDQCNPELTIKEYDLVYWRFHIKIVIQLIFWIISCLIIYCVSGPTLCPWFYLVSKKDSNWHEKY